LLGSGEVGHKGWHERGYLPHRDEPGLIQFITYHVKGSFPASLRSEWAALFEIEDDRKRRAKLEQYLDRGHGPCSLRKPQIGQIVENAFRYHHNRHYELLAWVVMPNHVHVMFRQLEKPLGKVIADWKEYTAREANKYLGRRGSFWAADYWDTYVRNDEHESKAMRYTENNPVKAGLSSKAASWPWSSARFRDQYGTLNL
jgi:REP element-mobilizing transposase RayT